MDQKDYSLYPIYLGNVSCFLIYRPGEAILVDCGSAGSELRILETLESLGLEPGMLKLLILTHAHFDHAGSAAMLKKHTGCSILIHALEAARLTAGFTDLPPGTRWKAKLLVGLGRTFASRMGKFPPSKADLLVDQEFHLNAYGFPGRALHTPGHTIGSLVVLMEKGELIGGDTLFGVEGKQHFPPFAEDLPALVESWKTIRKLDMKTIFPAHGRSFSRESFLAEFDLAIEKYSVHST